MGKQKKHMRVLLLLLISFNFFQAFGQDIISTNCNCNGFIDWSKVDTINFNGQKNLERLFKTEIPCGNDEYKIINDSSDYFLIRRDDYVITKYDTFAISRQSLWVKKQNIFCAYPRTYYEKRIAIYKQPDIDSDKIFDGILKDNEFFTLIIIKACINNWIKVQVTLSGVEYEGWIEKKYSCPLKCTTCT